VLFEGFFCGRQIIQIYLMAELDIALSFEGGGNALHLEYVKHVPSVTRSSCLLCTHNNLPPDPRDWEGGLLTSAYTGVMDEKGGRPTGTTDGPILPVS
jgi:hypothetical protein